MATNVKARILTALAVVMAVAIARVFIEFSVFGIPAEVKEIFREYRVLILFSSCCRYPAYCIIYANSS